jgi:hypothetical protein
MTETDPEILATDDSLMRDIRARDAALGPGFGNLNIDTADRRILLQKHDQAVRELFDALDEIDRLQATTKAKETAK